MQVIAEYDLDRGVICNFSTGDEEYVEVWMVTEGEEVGLVYLMTPCRRPRPRSYSRSRSRSQSRSRSDSISHSLVSSKSHESKNSKLSTNTGSRSSRPQGVTPSQETHWEVFLNGMDCHCQYQKYTSSKLQQTRISTNDRCIAQNFFTEANATNSSQLCPIWMTPVNRWAEKYGCSVSDSTSLVSGDTRELGVLSAVTVETGKKVTFAVKALHSDGGAPFILLESTVLSHQLI